MSSDSPSIDIFGLLSNDSSIKKEDEEKKKRRQELLEPTGVQEFFKDGKISINKFTCIGGQCKLCIEVCPTNALYWGSGEVGIIDDLCVYCGACVVHCMVDDCIKIERIREDGTNEQFSKLKDVVVTQDKDNGKKRFERVKSNAVLLRHICKIDNNKIVERKTLC